MTVSFTKEEVGWLLHFVTIATQDLNEEEEWEKEILDAGKKIKEKLNAHDDYKYKKHREIPLKVTASSLAERESNIEYAASKRPAFMDEGGLNAADRGTALHQCAAPWYPTR